MRVNPPVNIFDFRTVLFTNEKTLISVVHKKLIIPPIIIIIDGKILSMIHGSTHDSRNERTTLW